MSIVYAMCVPHPPLIIPEVGKGQEKGIQTTIDSYEAVMKKAASFHPDLVIITSPHSIMYSDYIHISPGASARGDFGSFGVPQVQISCKYDEVFVKELSALCTDLGVPAGILGERHKELDHATMIPLYFLQHYIQGFKVVRIGISGLSPLMHYRFGQAIRKISDDLGRKVVFIASGDLSHKLKEDGPYGYASEGPQFDSDITQAFESGDFMRFLTFSPDFCEEAAECGLRSFQIMAGALDRTSVISHLYSYEGPFGVGYGVAGFELHGFDASRDIGDQYEVKRRKELQKIKEQEDAYVQLARFTIEHYIKEGIKPHMPSHPQEMDERQAGVFVTLHKEGALRGCIGTFQPTTSSIAEEIMQNAISACARDPRFPPVEEDELEDLIYSVDVLGEVEDIDDINALDPQRYGVIVTSGMKRGLLLPDLEGVDTVMKQVDIARNKAGIHEGEPIQLARFEVVRHT